MLRAALFKKGCRYRVDVGSLPGRPDIVFGRARLAVFVDGDFWHGRGLEARLARLANGHNSAYWTKKLTTNVERDVRNTERLRADGWVVLRLWESDVLKNLPAAVDAVLAALSNARRKKSDP